MNRRKFLKLAAVFTVASAGLTMGETHQAEYIRRPRVERYGWIDENGYEVVGYRKVWPEVETMEEKGLWQTIRSAFRLSFAKRK